MRQDMGKLDGQKWAARTRCSGWKQQKQPVAERNSGEEFELSRGTIGVGNQRRKREERQVFKGKGSGK